MVAHLYRNVTGIGVLMLAAFACQAPAPVAPTPGAAELALTGTAIVQTLSAQRVVTAPVALTATFPTDAIPSATELPPIVSETASPVISPPTLTFTAVPSDPMASVTVGTNCRTGPGRVYDLVGGAEVGVKFAIVGKNSLTNYWIIRLPTGQECWLWGEHAIVEGDVQSLPEFAAPPTPTPLPALGTILVTVRGPVTSGENNALINNATVTFSATGQQAENLGNGTYRFMNVPVGPKEIRATAPDYLAQSRSVNVVGDPEPIRIEIPINWYHRRLLDCSFLPTPLQRRNCYVAAPFPSQLAPLP